MGFFSVAQGLAGLGRDIGTASDVVGQENRQTQQDELAKRLQELQSQREQQRLDIEQGRFGLEQAAAKRPQLHSTFGTDDGSMYAVMLDPSTGEPSVRVLRQGTNQYPEFKSLQEMETYAVEHNDNNLLQRAQAAIKATQRQTGETTPFEVWREQNPNAPISEWFALQEKYKKEEKTPRAETPFSVWYEKHKGEPVENYFKAAKLTDQTEIDKAKLALQKAQQNLSKISPFSSPFEYHNARKALDEARQNLIDATLATEQPDPKNLVPVE